MENWWELQTSEKTLRYSHPKNVGAEITHIKMFKLSSVKNKMDQVSSPPPAWHKFC